MRDASGAVIPGSQVNVTNEATGLARTAQTNESGYYVFPLLPAGFYTVAVESTGFKRSTTTGNKLDSSIALQVDVTLEVGDVSETIEVTAEAIQLQSETATVGRLVEEQQIKKLVLNGRNPILLAQLKPGVIRNGSMASFSFGLTSGGFSINGSRSQDNLISFDGAINMRTRSNGTSIGVPDVDTVAEVQILTSNYPAEFGGGMAGQMRFVTKSGSQQFHGSAYEYLRNRELDANSWDRNQGGQTRPQNTFNQFGYVVSGPVYTKNWNTDKDKLFWLWSQEWVRYRRDSTSIQTVPSLAMRNGDFSELLDPSNTFFGRTRAIIDPATGNPFPNNIIPAGSQSSNGMAFLQTFPDPTAGFQQGTNNFIQTRPQPTNQRKDTISIDYNPSDKHALRFRLQNYGLFEPEAFRGGTDRAIRTIDRPNRSYTLNHIWSIGPTLINDLNLNVSYDRVYLEVPITARLDRNTYGIDYPYVFPERKEIPIKIPTINIQNFVGIDGGPYPASSSGPIYQAADNLTKIIGNHTLKFGVRYERSGQNDFDQINVSGVPGGTNNQNGRFVFSDNRSGGSGVAIGNAALGLFNTYAEIGQRAFTPYRRQMGEAFAQDSWKVNDRLRLEYGVRYSIMTPYYYSVWRNMAVFDFDSYDPSRAAVLDPRTGNVLSGDRYNGVVIPGTGFTDAAFGRVAIADSGEFDRLFNGGEKYFGQVQKTEFQPRIGIAYRIDDKSVLRTGFGRYLARPGVADNFFLGGNPPFQPTVSISDGIADDPGAGESTGFPQFFQTMDPVYKMPASYQWNMTYQREIGFETLVEVGYVGRAATHMERVRDPNQLLPGTTQANPGINANFLRPYSGFANIVLGENAARSEYNGLQLSVERRFSDGLSFGVAYTYSKNNDNADNRRDQIYNNYDDSNYWGPADIDFRQALVTNFVYELPMFRDKSNIAGKMLGGWTLSGVIQFQSGRPVTVQTGDDFAGIGTNTNQPWEVTGDPRLGRSERQFANSGGDDAYWFRATGWSAPAPGTFSSTQTRNQWIRVPGFQNWNLGVFKEFSITETQSLTFRSEFFNLPNHPNLDAANTNPRSGAFGKVTSKGSERNIQLSLKYSF